MLPRVLALLCTVSAAAPLRAQTEYPLTPDSERQAGVPAGRVTAHRFESRVFPGTVRDYWVYVPAQYRPDTPAAVMVFQDGGGYVREDGRWRVPIVFDNLIHKGEMPVTIGVFIDPGVLPSATGDTPLRYGRSFEYDALGDRYARFLLEEILPEVGKGLNLTSDPSQYGTKRIVAYAPDGTETVIAEGVSSNDLVVNAKGEVWFTDPHDKRIRFIDREGRQRVVHEGIGFPNGIVLSPDQSMLAVADYSSKWVWSFSVDPDGSLRNGQPFYRLETADEPLDAAADGMTMDTEGYLYVATRVGIQVCDQPGRVTAIIGKPQATALANVVFGGPKLDTLYVTAEDKVFRRVVRRRGVFPWQVVAPSKPRL